MMSRTAEIKLTVDLDGYDLPTRIEWQASEGTRKRPGFVSIDDALSLGQREQDDCRDRSVD